MLDKNKMTNPNLPKYPNASKHPKSGGRAGYEYLSAYMLGKVIQELTHDFCQLFLKDPKDPNFPNTKLIEQMNGAARSNSQNVAEGYTHESLKGYIYLVGIANGSNEELTKDYEDYLKSRKLDVWGKNHPSVREFRGFRAKWNSPTSPNTPTLPVDAQRAGNMLLTYCNMEGYLLSKLADSLKEKHKTEGGLTENLYRNRTEYRSKIKKT